MRTNPVVAAGRIRCFVNGQRAPFHEPRNVPTDLFEAMGALRDELEKLESDIVVEGAMLSRSATDRRTLAIRRLVRRWQRQRDRLSRFYDVNVYLDFGVRS